MAFKELPRNKDLDELWLAGLLFSKSSSGDIGWEADTPDKWKGQPPSGANERWQFAIQVED